MHAHKINHLPTSQGESAHMFHKTQEHLAGEGSVVVPVKLQKTMHVDGFPVEPYVASVTPSQPCAVSVSDQTRYGFNVTLTALDGGALKAGTFSVLCVG